MGDNAANAAAYAVRIINNYFALGEWPPEQKRMAWRDQAPAAHKALIISLIAVA